MSLFDEFEANDFDTLFEWCHVNWNNEHNEHPLLKIHEEVKTLSRYFCWDDYCPTSIIMSHNVTSIGDAAFESCETIRHIKIPKTVDCIGLYVFTELPRECKVIIPKQWNNIVTHAELIKY